MQVEVVSKAVDKLSYNPKTNVLTVNYRNGVYHYQNVGQSVYDELRLSGSVGASVVKSLKGKYLFTREQVK